MENNKIVKYAEFERVDFDNPMTIISYGSSLLEEMGKFMKNVSSMASITPIDNLELEERLQRINSFSNYLEKEKESKTTGLVPIIKNKATSLTRIIKTKVLGVEELGASFADQYSLVNEEIDAIEVTVERKKQEVLESIKIDRLFSSNMKEYIEKLEYLINIGEEDLNEYKKSVFEKMTDENELKLANQSIGLFEKKLQSLKESLVVYKNSILESKLKENVNAGLVLQYQEYNESTIHVLRNQATSMITTKLQRDNLDAQQKLNEITNDAIKKNSSTIISNINKSNELASNGSIYLSTLEELSSNVKKGIELLKKGDEMMSSTIKNRQDVTEHIMDSIDSYSETLDQFTETKKQYVKRLGNDK